MKTTFFFLLIIVPVFLTAQSESIFVINGELTNIKGNIQKVFLDYRVGRRSISDSVDVKNNSYEFRGSISQAVKGTLSAQYQSQNGKLLKSSPLRDVIPFIIEKGNIDITSIDSFSNATVNAGEGNKDFINLQKKLKPYTAKKDLLRAQYDEAEKNKDSALMKKRRAEINLTDSVMKENV